MENKNKKIHIRFDNKKKEIEYISEYEDFIEKIKEIFNLPQNIKIYLFNIDFENEKISIENQEDYESCEYDHKGNLFFEVEIKLENLFVNNEKENKSNNNNEKENKSNNNNENISKNNYINNNNTFKNSFYDVNKEIIDIDSIENELKKEIKLEINSKFDKLHEQLKEYINIKLNEINDNIDQKFENINCILNTLSKNDNSILTENSDKTLNFQKTKSDSFSILNFPKNINHSFSTNKINTSSISNKSIPKASNFLCEIILEKKQYNFNTNELKNQFINVKIKNKSNRILPKGCILSSEDDKDIKIYHEINQYIKVNEEISFPCEIIFNEIQENKIISTKLKISHNNKNYSFKYNNSNVYFMIVKGNNNKIELNNRLTIGLMKDLMINKSRKNIFKFETIKQNKRKNKNNCIKLDKFNYNSIEDNVKYKERKY